MRRLGRLGVAARLLLALGVAGAVFGIASAVQASIPDASGVIHGCYFKFPNGEIRQGALRAVDTGAGQHCRSDETVLNWNAVGPTGTRGATGPTGPVGPSFGDGTYVDTANATGCADNELATLNVTVTKPSRIYGSGSGYFVPATLANTTSLDVQLRDAGDTTTLADTGSTFQLAGAPANGAAVIVDSNVLLTAPSHSSAYTVAPGTYVLRLDAHPFGQCAVVSYFRAIHLSYILRGTAP